MTATQGNGARESHGTRVMPFAPEATSVSAKAVVERSVRHMNAVKTTARSAIRAVALGAAVLLVGCSVTTGKRNPDGVITVTNWRCLWRSEAIQFDLIETNFNARLSIGKSVVDEQSVSAVAEGVAAGITKGVTRP